MAPEPNVAQPRRKALGPASQVDVPGKSQMMKVMETKWPSFV